MRVLPVVALLLLSPSLALAQDADPKPEPKPLLPPPDANPTPNNPPAVTPQAEEDDPAPMRLSAIIAQAASVQRRSRIANGVLGIVAGGGGIASGAVLLTLNTGATSDGTKIVGGIAMGFGGLTVLSSVWDLFSRTALERLDEAYAPIASDKRIPAAKRLSEGENALQSMAESGRSSRIFSGVTSIVLGVGLGIAAAPIAFAVAPDNAGISDAATFRAYIGFGFGLSAFLMVASGVTTIVVKRTEAEQLWNFWLAGTGRETSKLQPYLTPDGVGLRF